jgi:hypothetical protein
MLILEVRKQTHYSKDAEIFGHSVKVEFVLTQTQKEL